MIEIVAPRCARIPGVVAVTLGGSRARGEERPDSDWDFGLYYRGSIDADDVRSLGFAGEVFEVGAWGSIVNGGAWLDIEGTKVDLIYRDLGEVEHWTDEAAAGRFEVRREVGYIAGIATYVLAGELALAQVLHGSLPRPDFSEALAERAAAWWYHVADMALTVAAGHADRGDVAATCANAIQAALATAQGRLAARREWVLNEKGLLERAALGDLGRVLVSQIESPKKLVEETREALAV